MQKNSTDIEIQLESMNSCSPSEVCEQLTVELMSMELFFEQWEKFNLTSTWRFARKCYKTANRVVLGNVNKYSSERVNYCRMTPLFQGLYSQLPINDQEYPQYLLHQ